MKPAVLSGAAWVACVAACDPCPVRSVEAVGDEHFYDEIWANNGHNLVVEVHPERLPFDLLLDTMESIDAEFRCYSEDQQRGLTEWFGYQLRLPREVCWQEAESHFDSAYVEGFTPMRIAWVAEPPTERCDSAVYLAPNEESRPWSQ